ncbi:hypothetical protein DW1_1536 [Proteiniborus sp. DW1]|uniref:hypothetical protein n=1 Tax=Proteiniborus sp. DW1 TaxID=1889883 RepID=UPI00092DEAC9|nr:hypothetical protein [Proteiniborus sp. DW1]SCG83107.1 hypothetical protein DW1_1536 [Proteiniborus sp. DW1]
MTDNNNNRRQQHVLNNKGIFLAICILLLVIIIIAFIKHGRFVNSMIFSDYFFVVGTVLLILGALTRTFAWLVHKRSILKPRDENEDDVAKAKLVLKKASKTLSVIGFVNIIISLIFVVIYYYI